MKPTSQHDYRPQVFFGFDFGTKRIGIAVGQTLTATATPLATLNVSDIGPDWQILDDLIKQWSPAGCVVGMPYQLDGSKQWIAERAEEFAQQLKQRYNLAVYSIDERLTTVAAREQLYENGGFKQLQKANVDEYAAKLILEGWFAKQYH